MEMDCALVFRLDRGPLDNLLNGRLRFSCNSEGSATHSGRFWMLRVATVGGRGVDGDATVVAEALEAAAFLFFLRELPICPNAWVGAAGRGCIGRCGQVAARFTGAEEEAACLFRPEGAAFSPWRSQ